MVFPGLPDYGESRDFRLFSKSAGDYWWPGEEVLLHLIRLPKKKITKPPEELKACTDSNQREIWVYETLSRYILWRPGLRISLNLPKRQAEAQFAQDHEWQNVLRMIYFFNILKSPGLMLHASGVGRDGKAYVFPGPSGAGKTTIVRSSSGLPVLSDDIVAVHFPDKLSPANQPQAHGSPIYGDWGKPGEKLSAPLQGLYFPVKDGENRLVKLTTKETLARLLPCVCSFSTMPSRQEALFSLALKLADSTPGYALHFKPGPDFWQVINAG
jgi:hypothetical protein